MKLTNLISSSPTVDVYEQDGLAIKLFKSDARKTQALYEALTHSRVEATGLPVPIIREVSVIDDRWAIHMDLIEGKTLAQLMEENPQNKGKYLEQMVDLQMLVHSKSTPKLSKLKDKLARQINALDLDEIKKYELLTSLEAKPKHTKLCHGDFTPDNIIISDKGTFIVDWAAARQGNASADVGRTYLKFYLKSPELADKYLDLFCKKSLTSKRYVLEWLPIVAAAQLENSSSDEETELLMKWIDVVHYE